MAEFNTYDILKQRYLVLTREALAALKERSSINRSGAGLLGRPARSSRGATRRRAEPWSPCVAPPITCGPGPVLEPYQVVDPAPDHREGHPHLGATQRLHVRGQPAGDQDRDQERDRNALQRQGRRTSAPRTVGANPAATGSRSAGCGTGRKPSSRCTRNIGSIFIEKTDPENRAAG